MLRLYDRFIAEIPGRKRECLLLSYGFLAVCCLCHAYSIQRPSPNRECVINLFQYKLHYGAC